MLDCKAEEFKKPLSCFTDNTTFAVMSVASIHAYANGKRTDTVVGTKYIVADPDSFENFEVRVNNPTPVVTQDKIESARASKQRYWITFTNAEVKPTKIEFGIVTCTVTADSAQLDG